MSNQFDAFNFIDFDINELDLSGFCLDDQIIAPAIPPEPVVAKHITKTVYRADSDDSDKSDESGNESDESDDTMPLEDLLEKFGLDPKKANVGRYKALANALANRAEKEKEKKKAQKELERKKKERINAEMQCKQDLYDARIARFVDPTIFASASQADIRKLIVQYKTTRLDSIDYPDFDETFVESGPKHATHIVRDVSIDCMRGLRKYHHFTTFNDCVEYVKSRRAALSPSNPISIHEHVLGAYPFKAFLDIDIDKSKDEYVKLRKMFNDERGLVDVIARSYINAFMIAERDISKNEIKPCTPYVVYRNDSVKLSFHIIANDSGFICSNSENAMQFANIVKGMFTGVYEPLATFIDCLYKRKFSLRLPEFVKIAEHGTKCGKASPFELKRGSELKPYKTFGASDYSSYFLQKLDVVRGSILPSAASCNHNVMPSRIAEITERVVADFPHFSFSKLSETRDDIVAIFVRNTNAPIKCTAHGEEHQSLGAFLRVSVFNGKETYGLYCFKSPCKLLKHYNTKYVADSPITTVTRCTSDYVRKTCKYIYGDGGMIESIPSLIEDPSFWNRDIYIKSAYGTGKTVFLRKIVEEARKSLMRVLIISPRISLSSKLSADCGASYYGDIKTFVPKEHGACVFQYESLYKVARYHFDVVIIDEPATLISHINSNIPKVGGCAGDCRQVSVSSFNNQRILEGILSPFMSGMLIALDNDMSDEIVDSFAAVRKESNKIVYVNDYKPYCHVKATIDFSKGSKKRLDEKIEFEIKKNLALLESGKQHAGIVISCHKYNDCKYYGGKAESLIPSKYHHLIHVHTGGTNTTERVETFKNIEAVWDGALVVIYNQAVSVGVSFDKEHFTHVFGMFESLWMDISAIQTVQSLFRCRKTEEMYLAIVRPHYDSTKYTPMRSKKDVAKRLVYKDRHITVQINKTDCVINHPTFIDIGITAIASSTHNDKELTNMIDNYLGSSFMTRSWVYRELIQSLTITDVVEYMHYLLCNVGVQVEFFNPASITPEELEKITAWVSNHQIAKREIKQKNTRALNEIIDNVANQEDAREMYPQLAIEMGLVESKYPGVFVDDERALQFLSDDGARESIQYATGEKDAILRYRVSLIIPSKDYHDVTDADIRRFEMSIVQRQAFHSMTHPTGVINRRSALIDNTYFATNHARVILEELYGYRQIDIKAKCEKRVTFASMLDPVHLPLLQSLKKEVTNLLDPRFDKDGKFKFTELKSVHSLINKYLNVVGAKVVRERVGKSKEQFSAVQWMNGLTIPVDQPDLTLPPEIAQCFVE